MKHETTYLRGARSFVAGRFETLAREPFDDGWTPEERDAAELQTSVTEERARSIISRNDSPDIGFSQSINPYRGCEHGCIYCVHGDTAVLMADSRAGRPELRIGNKMMRVGALAHAPVKNEYYRLGYLCGVIRGDGHLASHRFRRGNGAIGTLHQFRLALCDVEALLRVQDYLREWQIDTQHFVFQRAAAGRRLLHAIRTL